MWSKEEAVGRTYKLVTVRLVPEGGIMEPPLLDGFGEVGELGSPSHYSCALAVRVVLLETVEVVLPECETSDIL
ncbi:hypothetical protein FOZ60_002284 [Perkinsus olseni]|uniref:Uncharacterized protein n=1 Tax=Perkinsus olseni TaxID=32597 RepID=A0A7J6N6L3_PEROL|nr:hypothetical protein FOZ60_015079 [Perkinsus olseni]KAF4696052.1 hypothetical protein FOZ60_002284 [Perkinsus olseni]